jgi:hypothetical protein
MVGGDVLQLSRIQSVIYTPLVKDQTAAKGGAHYIAPLLCPSCSIALPFILHCSALHAPLLYPSCSIALPFILHCFALHACPSYSIALPFMLHCSALHTPLLCPSCSIALPFMLHCSTLHAPLLCPSYSIALPFILHCSALHAPLLCPSYSIALPFILHCSALQGRGPKIIMRIIFLSNPQALTHCSAASQRVASAWQDYWQCHHRLLCNFLPGPARNCN